MRFKKTALTTLVIAACALSGVSAMGAASVNDPKDKSASFFEHSEDGWWWYQDDAPKTPEKPAEEKKPAEVQLKDAENKQKAFSVAWLRENLPRYRDLAIDSPTAENVKAYLLIQRIMLDKAENFSTSVQAQVVGDALVDENARRAFSTMASHKINAQATENTETLLKKLSEKVGLFYFFSSSCSYCKIQFPLLQTFRKKYGMAILGVSLDGQGPDNAPDFKWKPDSGVAEKLGIMQVPALVLVTPENEFEVIAQGVLSLPEIEGRVLVASKRRGWISEKEFEETRPMIAALRNDLSKALETKSESAEAKLKSYQNPDGFIDPHKLVSLITQRAKFTNTDMSTAKASPVALEAAESLKKSALPEELAKSSKGAAK